MTTYTRQFLSHQAPLVMHELRQAFEQNEPALQVLAEQQRTILQNDLPDTLQVPFHFDQFQVYAVYRVHEGVFSQLVAYAAEDGPVTGPTFSFTIFLTS